MITKYISIQILLHTIRILCKTCKPYIHYKKQANLQTEHKFSRNHLTISAQPAIIKSTPAHCDAVTGSLKTSSAAKRPKR